MTEQTKKQMASELALIKRIQALRDAITHLRDFATSGRELENDDRTFMKNIAEAAIANDDKAGKIPL